MWLANPAEDFLTTYGLESNSTLKFIQDNMVSDVNGWWDMRVPDKNKWTLFRGAVYGASRMGLTALLRDYLRLQACMLGAASWEGHIKPLSSSGVGTMALWRLQSTNYVYNGLENLRGTLIFYAVFSDDRNSRRRQGHLFLSGLDAMRTSTRTDGYAANDGPTHGEPQSFCFR